LDYLIANPDAVLSTYEETYGGNEEKGTEIINGDRTNFENEQKLLVNEWSSLSAYEADEFERTWIRKGGKHYDWDNGETYYNDDGINAMIPHSADAIIDFCENVKKLSTEVLKIIDCEDINLLSIIIDNEIKYRECEDSGLLDD
jgi:hypothetical protein